MFLGLGLLEKCGEHFVQMGTGAFSGHKLAVYKYQGVVYPILYDLTIFCLFYQRRQDLPTSYVTDLGSTCVGRWQHLVLQKFIENVANS